MKAISLIPKKVIKTYNIREWDTELSINHPCYVNIRFDDRFNITIEQESVRIGNDKCVVTLYTNRKFVHITIL